MKKALILYYSQAGQTQKAIDIFSRGLAKNVGYDALRIDSREEFSFPWKMRNFFRAFPRCVRGPAPEVNSLGIDWSKYDLVILGYQVWFLSPSLPMQGFLQSKEALGLKGKKVITLSTCRNLWQSAWQRINTSLTQLGALHLGQVTVCELSPIWASFVTTPRWMLMGKKNAFAFFPEAGISSEEFAKLEEKGRKLGESWVCSHGESVIKSELSSNLDRLSFALMDKVGIRFFQLWAALIEALAPKAGLWQDALLVLFRLTLVILILCVAPCTKIIELFVVRYNSKTFLRDQRSRA